MRGRTGCDETKPGQNDLHKIAGVLHRAPQRGDNVAKTTHLNSARTMSRMMPMPHVHVAHS